MVSASPCLSDSGAEDSEAGGNGTVTAELSTPVARARPSGPAGGAPADAYYLPILRPGLELPLLAHPAAAAARPFRVTVTSRRGAVSGPAARPRRNQPTVTGGFRCCGGPDHPSQ